MSLRQWLENSWVVSVTPSANEVRKLLAVVNREFVDASIEALSVDGRFEHAYNAARCLCEIALHAAGYTAKGGQRNHERTIESIRFTLGTQWADTADFLGVCRRKRGQVTYERTGVVQPRDTAELLDTARKLHAAVLQWLREHHPGLV